MSNAKVEAWGYHETLDRYYPDGSCRNVRWIGRCTISQLIKAVERFGNKDHASGKWIRDRMSPTGNAFEKTLLEISNFRYIICYDDKTRDIIHTIPLTDILIGDCINGR